jgi:LacI family transcriptional regulator
VCTLDRYEGFRRALQEAGLEPDPDLLWQGDFTIAGGEECARTIFSLPPEQRPGALFVANDQMAFGILDKARMYGVRVPQDIAILGFDDMPMAQYAQPGLTTIRQPLREIGQRACELLLSLVDPKNHPFQHTNETFSETEEGGSKNIRVLLPTKLIVRESCGAKQSVSHQV